MALRLSSLFLVLAIVAMIVSPFGILVETNLWVVVAIVLGALGGLFRLVAQREGREMAVPHHQEPMTTEIDLSSLRALRAEKDRYFAVSPESPLTAEQRSSFNGLAYFPINSDAVFIVRVVEFPEKVSVPIGTSTGDVFDYLRWGEIRFTYGETPCRLTVFRADPHDENLFLPFRDETSGQQTYGAGRYLELIDGEDELYLLDFNRAYNPYCAYNESWTCPMPPPENRLPVAVEAGEKNFPGHA